MLFKKQGLWVSVVILVLFVLLTSQCMNGQSRFQTAYEPVSGDPTFNTSIGAKVDEIAQLSITVMMNEREYAALEQLNYDFQQEHPEIIVQLTNADPEEAYDMLKQAAQKGDSPDVMLLDNIWIREFAMLGYVLPIDALFSTESQSEQYDGTMDLLRWNGYLWAIPVELDPYVLVWNKQRFKDAGIGERPQSAEAFIETNQLLTNLDNQQYGLDLDLNDPYAFLSLIWSLGAEWTGKAEENESVFNNLLTEQLSRLFTIDIEAKDGAVQETLPAEHVEQPVSYLTYLDQLDPGMGWQYLLQGQTAMRIAKLSDFITHRGDGGELQYAPFTRSDGDQPKGIWLAGKSLAISARTSQEQAATTWIRAMSATASQRTLSENGGGVPAIKAALSDPYYGTVSDLQYVRTAVDQARTLLPNPHLRQWMEQLTEEVKSLRSGNITIDQWAIQANNRWLEGDF